MKKIWGIISLLAILFVLVACGNESSNESQQAEETESTKDKLKIFTTVYPLQFFADRIAGDEASVESILPPGADSHTYEPTSKEMVEIAEGNAFIYNGAGLEAYAEQISDTVQAEGVEILEASEGVELNDHVHNHNHDHESEGSEHAHTEGDGEEAHAGHNHGDQDPHVWLDPLKSVTMAENIKDMLVELRPDQEDVFQKNFEELESELRNLDEKFHTGLEEVPGNEIIVSHAAYGYWEQAYGIEQIAISGLSPVNEPSQKELQSIIETAEQHGLNHVFFEQNVTPKVAETVRKEIGAETSRIHNLSVLTEEDIADEETYFTLMNRNLERLKEALSIPSSGNGDSSTEGDHEEHDHNHSHGHSEESKSIYDGYFEDSQVKDRPLSDWKGDWQSVYPYHQNGTLDEVYAHKAENGDKSSEEYKEYYQQGYETEVDRIEIIGDKVTFHEDGSSYSGTYANDGYEILTYEAGNRGVRYIFKETGDSEQAPTYIQFSDHSISPTDAGHYHLYWGEDRESLLQEVENWPTYYPSEMDGPEIAHEMMHH